MPKNALPPPKTVETDKRKSKRERGRGEETTENSNITKATNVLKILISIYSLTASADDIHEIDAKYDAAPAAAPKTWTSRRRSFSSRRRYIIPVYRRRRSIDFSRRRSIYLSRRRRRRRSSALQILGNKMILGMACITALYCLGQ